MRSREDWLYAQLELLEESGKVHSAEYLAIQAELDDMANRVSRQQAKAKAEAELRAQRKAEILAALGNQDLSLTIRLGGDEFQDDYEIIIEGSDFVVYSKVANEHQESRHVCSSHEQAMLRLNQLLYYRIYDHYVRHNGDYEGVVAYVEEVYKT